MTKVLYNNNHLVNTSVDNTNRTSVLKIEIEKNLLGKPSKEDLVISLTDFDSLFLLLFEINDENFAELKKTQALLVDLPDFVLRLVDLLEICRLEECNESPKHFLTLCKKGGSWDLNFIEVNPMKQLTQLTLEFCHADEIHFKKYLTDCLKSCRLENADLSSKLQSTEAILTKKLQDTERALETVTKELQKEKITFELQLDDIRDQLRQQTNIDKEKLLEIENKFNQERVDRQKSFAVQMHEIDSKNQDIEDINRPTMMNIGIMDGCVQNITSTCSQPGPSQPITFQYDLTNTPTASNNNANVNNALCRELFNLQGPASPAFQFNTFSCEVAKNDSVYVFGTNSVRAINPEHVKKRRALKVRRKR